MSEKRKVRSTGDPLLDAAIAKARGSKPFEPIDIEAFCRIFEFTSKRELERYSKTLVVNSSDLAALILCCKAVGEPFRHMNHHREYVPEHLVPTERDRATMATAKVGTMPQDVAKAFGKISQIFKDRRLLNGHMFICPQTNRWHFLYFDQRDTDVRDPHWEHGAHIHFVNWLWPGLTGQSVWETFANKKPKFRGALHLRYLDWRLEDEEGRRARKPLRGTPHS